VGLNTPVKALEELNKCDLNHISESAFSIKRVKKDKTKGEEVEGEKED